MVIKKLSYTKYTRGLFFFCLLFFYSCSIKDSLDNCPVPFDGQDLLYIKVKDVLLGEDVTRTEDLENLTLFVFDNNRTFTRSLTIPISQISQYTPIDVTSLNLEGAYISAWANINDLISEPTSRIGDKTTDLALMLVPNALTEPFYQCPGDLFFGFQQIDFKTINANQQISVDTVEIMRKNARLHVTVRGVQDTSDAEQYYFKLYNRFAGYNFEGAPVPELFEILELGEFNDEGEFVSAEPYMMIHSASEITDDENSIYVYFMMVNDEVSDSPHKVGSNDIEIAKVNKDMNGKYIYLESGKITYVLIDVSDPGDVQVQFVITDWDYIHQWERW